MSSSPYPNLPRPKLVLPQTSTSLSTSLSTSTSPSSSPWVFLLRNYRSPRLPALLMTTTTLLLLFTTRATATPTSPVLPHIDSHIDTRMDTHAGSHGIFVPGTTCAPAMEGIWNCMVTTWQRCAEGHWSVVMPCKDGMVCAPAGVEFEMRMVPPAPAPASRGEWDDGGDDGDDGQGQGQKGGNGGQTPPETAAGNSGDWGGPGGPRGGWGNGGARVGGGGVGKGRIFGVVVAWLVVGGALF